MRLRSIHLFLTICLIFGFQPGRLQAQTFEVVNGDTINRTDTAGRKQGLWKYWDNNLSLVLSCFYDDDKPVGKQTYYQKNKTILELEPARNKKEVTWKYYGGGKVVQGILRKGKKKFEFVNVKGERLKSSEIQILTELMEHDAAYRGGYYELFRYFKDHIKYPKSPEQAKKEGIVEVTFVVKENGEIGDVRLISGFDVECNEATLECVKSMPKWRPAVKMGYAFESMVKVPVQFKQL
jgi:TonB family protein